MDDRAERRVRHLRPGRTPDRQGRFNVRDAVRGCRVLERHGLRRHCREPRVDQRSSGCEEDCGHAQDRAGRAGARIHQVSVLVVADRVSLERDREHVAGVRASFRLVDVMLADVPAAVGPDAQRIRHRPEVRRIRAVGEQTDNQALLGGGGELKRGVAARDQLGADDWNAAAVAVADVRDGIRADHELGRGGLPDDRGVDRPCDRRRRRGRRDHAEHSVPDARACALSEEWWRRFSALRGTR